MIIVNDSSIRVRLLEKAEAILFVTDGDYYYVDSGIIENELRVMQNWDMANPDLPDAAPWLIILQQGDQIPQELGDYLVTHQDIEDLEAKVLIVKRGVFDVAAPYETYTGAEDRAFELGAIAGIFECGEILSSPLPHQDNDQASNETEQTED